MDNGFAAEYGERVRVKVLEQMERCIAERGLAGPQAPVLLMVSGGSDSTALAYLAADLHGRGVLGPLGILHVNHRLRGADADADEEFVRRLAALLGIRLFAHSIDVGAIAAEEGGNVEAVARRERYRAAEEALAELCRLAAAPIAEGRIFTAHTADDRVESFYMRSIVGTGPGGFRSMRYRNGRVCRPLLDAGRQELRDYLRERAEAGLPVARDAAGGGLGGPRGARPDAGGGACGEGRRGAGALWREDATNAHTDRFRAFVRHEIVPRAKDRNPHLLTTLTRTMNLVADEDDMLQAQADELVERAVEWLGWDAEPTPVPPRTDPRSAGCLLLPAFGDAPLPLARRAVTGILQRMLGADARIETASVEAVLAGFAPAEPVASQTSAASQAWGGSAASDAPAPEPRSRALLAGIGVPRSGYVTNIQGNLAVSANKRGVRIEPMAVFRARRKRG